MKYLQLAKHLIPVILIKFVEYHEEEGVEGDTPVTWTSTLIHFRDGTSIKVDDDFVDICQDLDSTPG